MPRACLWPQLSHRLMSLEHGLKSTSVTYALSAKKKDGHRLHDRSIEVSYDENQSVYAENQKMLKTIHNRREGRGNTRQKGCERNAWLDKQIMVTAKET